MPEAGASSAIAGVGVDAVDIARFARALERAPRFARRVFADGEQALPTASLAARFAAREAAMKAIGGLAGGVALRDLEVIRGGDGAPAFRRGPRLEALLRARGIAAMHLSLTHDGPLALAFVVAERAPAAESRA